MTQQDVALVGEHGTERAALRVFVHRGAAACAWPAATTVVAVLALAAAWSFGDDAGRERDAVATASMDGADPAAPSIDSDPAPARPDGSLAAFDAEFGSAISVSDDGAAVVTVEPPSGPALRILLSASLAEELGRFALLAHMTLQCDPSCGYAEVTAEYQPSRQRPNTVRQAFERADGVTVARVDDHGDVLRFEIAPWVVSVPTGGIPAEFIEDWAAMPIRVERTGWIRIGDATSRFAPLDGRASSVALSSGANHVQLSGSTCESGIEGLTLTEFDDGGMAAFGTACLMGGAARLQADIDEAFVTRVLDGVGSS